MAAKVWCFYWRSHLASFGMEVYSAYRQWREGLIVTLIKKGDREQPWNYRGITLLSVVYR